MSVKQFSKNMYTKIYFLSISIFATVSILFIFGCSSPLCLHDPAPKPEVTNPQTFKNVSQIAFPSLLDVKFEDSLKGYISGLSGFVRKTSNGGVSWTNIDVPSVGDVYGVYFINNTDGFAGANNGDLFKTTNGGTSWTKLTTPNSSYNYGQFHFFDAMNGLAFGGSPSTTAAILKTTNGGATWTDVSVPGMSSVYDVEFIDNTTGYLCGSNNNIYKTTDGGATWVNQPVTITTPASNWILLAEIKFINSTVGYCVGYSISFDKNFIFKTTNGGATWNQLASPAQTAPTADVYTSFFAPSANEIYIVGGNVANNTGTLLKSTDGGISWSNISPNTSRLFASTFIQNTSYIVGVNGTIIKSRGY